MNQYRTLVWKGERLVFVTHAIILFFFLQTSYTFNYYRSTLTGRNAVSEKATTNSVPVLTIASNALVLMLPMRI